MKRSQTSMNGLIGDKRDDKSPKRMSSWTYSLFNSMKDKSIIVSKDEIITIIKDKYPKSRHHFLVLLNGISIEDIHSLDKSHIHLIDYMQNEAKIIANKTDISSEFRFGFHVNPSLKPLHLHVISQDFDSKYLKTKKHYNSFTTHFFIDSKSVIEKLNEYGKVDTISREDAEQLIKQDISCHFCHLKIDNIPKLKKHLLIHYPK